MGLRIDIYLLWLGVWRADRPSDSSQKARGMERKKEGKKEGRKIFSLSESRPPLVWSSKSFGQFARRLRRLQVGKNIHFPPFLQKGAPSFEDITCYRGWFGHLTVRKHKKGSKIGKKYFCKG